MLDDYLAKWEPPHSQNFMVQSAFRWMVLGHREIADMITSLICHGTLTRFPKLRIASVENGSAWVRPLMERMAKTYERMPGVFDEDPIVALKRNIMLKKMVKAKKLRYYADANFKSRVLPPPALAAGQYADVPPARPDDWSGLAIPSVPAVATSAVAEGLGCTADDGGPRRQPGRQPPATEISRERRPASTAGLLVLIGLGLAAAVLSRTWGDMLPSLGDPTIISPGTWAVLIAGVTPFPFKVITIASGATQLSLVVFLVASLVARLGTRPAGCTAGSCCARSPSARTTSCSTATTPSRSSCSQSTSATRRCSTNGPASRRASLSPSILWTYSSPGCAGVTPRRK